jgi:RNA polymerase sigma factor (sigma-70 family)
MIKNVFNKSANLLIRDNVVSTYLREISHIPTLTLDEEMELFKAYAASKARVEAVVGANDFHVIKKNEEVIQAQIKNEIISRNQRFNFAIAKRYDNSDMVMDLVSIGAIGMHEAFENFDYTKNVRFCTYAKFFIQRAINAYLTKENCMIRTSNDVKLLPKVKRITSRFFAKEGRYPNTDEIISILESKYNIKNVNPADLNMASISYLDDHVNDDDKENFTISSSSFIATKTASYNDYEAKSEYEHLIHFLKQELGKLSDRERTIICMAAGYGYDKEYKDAEIAEEINLTSERVRQIRTMTQKKLMKALTVTR